MGQKELDFAFIRKTTGLKGIITGGPQERSLRAGTENVCGIVGLGKSIRTFSESYGGIYQPYAEYKRIMQLKDFLLK